ncbi:molybdopterin molybdenumtransferase MoeA, partial [Azospirillum brasilense]|nr:molybdopterin molybdenumtransferase MoeA [Azospirillum brasilense]
MLQVGEARARILAAFTALPAETVPLPDALGRVLAEPAVARLTQPPFAAAAMDGWAVRAADIVPASAGAPVTLPRIGEPPARPALAGTVRAGEARRLLPPRPPPARAAAGGMEGGCGDAGGRG